MSIRKSIMLAAVAVLAITSLGASRASAHGGWGSYHEPVRLAPTIRYPIRLGPPYALAPCYATICCLPLHHYPCALR